MNEMELYKTIGALEERLRQLEERFAAFVAAPPAQPSSGSGGKWETTGEYSHTITRIGRAKDTKGNIFLVLWNGRMGIWEYYWSRQDKDQFLALLEELSGVKLNAIPWINDVKANDVERQLMACTPFNLQQKKIKKGDKEKYVVSGISRIAETAHAAPQTQPPSTTLDTTKLLHDAWTRHQIIEDKARLMLVGITTPAEAYAVFAKGARPVKINTDYLAKHGVAVPIEDWAKKEILDYAFAHTISEAQFKVILQMAGGRDGLFDWFPLADFKLWHFEYAIDLGKDLL